MEEKKKGFFSRLVEGLTKTRENIVSGMDSIFSGFSAIDDDFYEELEETLIMGDMGIQTTMAVIEDLKKTVKEQHIKEPEKCREALIASIRAKMDLGENAYEFENRKSVVLVIGVNGVGKTTSIGKLADQLKAEGIENVLALRGDIPKDGKVENDYRYASELIAEIKASGDFCIGAACYPEGHVESVNKTEDIQHLKEKVEAGCDFVTTQMFFDNNILYNYMFKLLRHDIRVPVIAGIMPVTNAKQIKRIMSLSSSSMPTRFKAIVDRFANNPEAMKQAGIAYATDQIIDLLANGVNNIHIYSMNKPEIAIAIMNNLSEIIKC